MIIYEGPSLLDGQPIVAVLTGHEKPSANDKTGTMAQLWIMPRDTAPNESLRTGEDESVCGDCPLRGVLGKQRACYVAVHQAPLSVWKKYQRGGYPAWIPGLAIPTHPKVEGVRLGAWGDPAALPFHILVALTEQFEGWTGYTHQWRQLGPQHASLLMASVETAEQAAEARAAGWRTYGLEEDDESILCPATSHGITCSDCGLCKGTASGAKSIYNPPHGRGRKYVTS